MRRLLPVLLVAAGCTDFPGPEALTKPTILAIVAEPPVLAPGDEAALSVVLAGPDGPMEPSEVTWRLVETYPGLPVFGEVVGDGAAARFVAPDPVPDLPEGIAPLTTVEVTVEAGDTSIVALKALAVIEDLPAPVTNPVVSVLAIDFAIAGPAVTLAAGDEVWLDVGTAPRAGEDAAYAWYSTVGEIPRFQSNPAALEVQDEPGEGWIFVVVRDGRGGVAWRGVQVTVE